MITALQRHPKSKEFIFLSVLCVICFLLIGFRIFYTQSIIYLFLVWNLFLAGIPWVISSLAVTSKMSRTNNWWMLLAAIPWLLFFPNAPYILTDLFHLQLHSTAPIWFDLILILSFAWTGLMFALLSLRDFESLLSNKFAKKTGIIASTVILFVSSFGVYIGRFLRWNSWDILHAPHLLLADILDRFVHPMDHPRTWGMTILMGLFLNLVYWSFRSIKNISSTNYQLAQ